MLTRVLHRLLLVALVLGPGTALGLDSVSPNSRLEKNQPFGEVHLAESLRNSELHSGNYDAELELTLGCYLATKGKGKELFRQNIREAVEQGGIRGGVGYVKGDKIGISRFSQRLKGGTLKDPKTGQQLRPDRARNSGAGGHGGSHWKLFDKNGNRTGTISKDGVFLRD